MRQIDRQTDRECFETKNSVEVAVGRATGVRFPIRAEFLFFTRYRQILGPIHSSIRRFLTATEA
jgi:hypothetical protein